MKSMRVDCSWEILGAAGAQNLALFAAEEMTVSFELQERRRGGDRRRSDKGLPPGVIRDRRMKPDPRMPFVQETTFDEWAALHAEYSGSDTSYWQGWSLPSPD